MSYNYSGEYGRDIYDNRKNGCDEYGRDIYDNRKGGCDECGRDDGCDEQLVLAIATVPMQRWRLTYSSEKALHEGTMFAELNMPFKGGKRR